MEMGLLNKIIIARTRINHEVTIAVSGVSMLPTMHEGDKVTIKKTDDYVPGDILAFLYKDNLMLVHRLVAIKNNRYYIKGDNAFRMEDVEFDSIVGKVILLNGKALEPTLTYVVALSRLVNQCFRKCGYNVSATMKSGIYRFYNQYMNNLYDDTLHYEKKCLLYRKEDEKYTDNLSSQIIDMLDTPQDNKSLITHLDNAFPGTSHSDIFLALNSILARGIVDGIIIVK